MFDYKKFLFFLNISILTLLASELEAEEVKFYDFSTLHVIHNSQLSEIETTALSFLIDELENRTALTLSSGSIWPGDDVPIVVIGMLNTFNNYSQMDPSEISSKIQDDEQKPEGFSIIFKKDEREAPIVFILGNDERGLLYGIGHFLRKSIIVPNSGNDFGQILVDEEITTSTYPAISLRGHQLGYRPKTNSYTGWDLDVWEQYIRDLIVFGTNAVEILPPDTDDMDYTEMFPRPQMDMMKKMNELLIKYRMDTWIWYPLMHGDYTKNEIIEKSLSENEEIFSHLDQLDAIFIPGGDPGSTSPGVLFEYLEKQYEILNKYHPEAEVWVSPQSFNHEEMELFLQMVNNEPEWLTGIVYGPQVRLYIDQLRKRIPESMPIRRYPDITHTYDAQYPVPNWDHAYAVTQNREPINPRPVAQKKIFHAADQNDYDGFITYSEGINDDVNKIIWSSLGWDPNLEVFEILKDYSRYFLNSDYEYDFSHALLKLEKNWDGPLISNDQVANTYQIFKSMGAEATPAIRSNWRFILAQFRAYYDHYVRSNLIYEKGLENRAMEVLQEAPRTGSINAIKLANEILNETLYYNAAQSTRDRLFELAEALFHTIRMQKSVEKYFATHSRRGANLDLIDWPLNNRRWLVVQFEEIKKFENESDRLSKIDDIVNWENPGPGGFYTDLGNLENQDHVIINQNYENDPAFLNGTFVGFAVGWDRTVDFRISWARYMHTLYDAPLTMEYTNLDKDVSYSLRATYLNQYRNQSVKLIANDDIEIHPYVLKFFPVHFIEVDIPREATKSGTLELKWIQDLGMGGTGRGNQLGEVWLMKKKKTIR